MRRDIGSILQAQQCHNDSTAFVDSIMQWAQDAGKWTGIVTTAAVTDASPAASYAHSGYRRWQSHVPKSCNASDIAKQMIYDSPGKNMRVILGGGRKAFRNATKTDEEDQKGQRKDGLDLIDAWQTMKRNASALYIWNRSALLQVDTNGTDYLLGGRIDHAHHENRAKLVLQETLEFDEAVNESVRVLPENETLIVVTADHSHTMTIAGHPSRGTNILGIAGYGTIPNKTEVQSNTTTKPEATARNSRGRRARTRKPKEKTEKSYFNYTVLSYAVGPGGYKYLQSLSETQTSSDDYVQQATFPMRSATHGGEDVAVYARGPWAHLFDGVNDQTYIPYVIAYALCIGQFNGSECHECKT
ncbi:hypothetical protein MTO96_008008 [Rhipicephalus appendiculatus]